MSPISSISGISLPGSISPPVVNRDSSGFGKVLEGAINSLDSLQRNESQTIQQYLTGENEDLHTTALATQRAEIAFELGLQIRNKVVNAYQEVMKMQL
jgi:flagellar hook-basal body complex protein FliE